ncbi:MAG: serine/threonine-protein kinase, partial [Planctomycetota bacterium]
MPGGSAGESDGLPREEQESAGLFSRLLSQVESSAPSEIATVHEGDLVGDFELLELLGRGGMGEVWAAQQRSLKRRVALKLVLPERVSEQSLALFAREARAGGRLSHPGIVTVYDHGDADGLAWIAMELVEGAHTLRDLLDELLAADQVPDGYHTQAAEFIATAADALQAAHEAGVIHRDIKPQNLLIGSDEQPKITDFGLARITDEEMLSVTGDFAGTYAYMSPEQAMAKRMGLDHRTDIFSLGVTFYEMLALRRPFEGDTAAQIAEQIVTKEAPDPRAIRSRVPRDLAVICGKCLEKDRDRRYQSMAELAADLDRYLADEPILATPPSTWQRAVKWTRRHPTRSVAAAISVIAFGAIAWLLAANLAANEDLQIANGDLQTSRDTISEKNATLESNLTEIQRQLTEIGRLSAMQGVEDLLADADELWPVIPADIPRYESWIRTAGSLLEELPQYYETREVVRRNALEQTDEELREQREKHPDYPRLVELRARRAALLQRRDGIAVQLPSVGKGSLPENVSELFAIAEPLVVPARATFGKEGLGMVAAQRAVA